MWQTSNQSHVEIEKSQYQPGITLFISLQVLLRSVRFCMSLSDKMPFFEKNMLIATTDEEVNILGYFYPNGN